MFTPILNPNDSRPLYEQLYRYIRGEIESGRLAAGERRRLNLATPGNSASASRPGLSDRRRRTRAQPPKVLRRSQTRRSNGLRRSPLFKNARA